MAGVVLKQISKSFGSTHVLRGIDIDIRDGEFLTLLGPSGCGKSTLLRIIAGLEHHDSGSVSIGGRVIDRLAPKDRNVAMVFQTYALYPHLTVRGNMALPLRMKRLTGPQRWPLIGRMLPGAGKALADIQGEVEVVAETLGLTSLLDRRPSQLSGGQRQRVAVGRAMVRQPAVFLMDEPLSNLDAERRTLMRAELAALHRRLGVTFIYVTHDQVEAMTLSTRVAVMDGGVVLQIGTPQEIYDAPADRRVAEFVGSPRMNVLTAQVENGTLVLEGRRLWPASTSNNSRPIFLGIRPEAISLVAAATPTSCALRIESVEHLGSDVHVNCISGEGQRFVLRTSSTSAGLLRHGETVHAELDPSAIHLFEEDGSRSPTGSREPSPRKAKR
jgi:multiple sugar transport system ATP-binding protein